MLENIDRVRALNQKLHFSGSKIFSLYINIYEIEIHLIIKHMP